jgi:hypothetical protein
MMTPAASSQQAFKRWHTSLQTTIYWAARLPSATTVVAMMSKMTAKATEILLQLHPYSAADVLLPRVTTTCTKTELHLKPQYHSLYANRSPSLRNRCNLTDIRTALSLIAAISASTQTTFIVLSIRNSQHRRNPLEQPDNTPHQMQLRQGEQHGQRNRSR